MKEAGIISDVSASCLNVEDITAEGILHKQKVTQPVWNSTRSITEAEWRIWGNRTEEIMGSILFYGNEWLPPPSTTSFSCATQGSRLFTAIDCNQEKKLLDLGNHRVVYF